MEQTEIKIFSTRINHRLQGGIGASWHAISLEEIDESADYKYALRYKNSRGSAWGGNPPVNNTAEWNQIFNHASWLGFSWIRVELSMRMYENKKGIFDWDNEEMLALYKILDWAEENDADVFLQQMWSNVKWNSYPEVQPLLSAPVSVKDFAGGIVRLIEYLITEKKYTCIKWFCMTNEPPGGSWGSWWSKGEKDASITPALKEIRKQLDEKNLNIPLSGPDWTDLPDLDPEKIDFDPYIGAYDIHSYQGIDPKKQQIIKKWVDWARDHGKPFFLSEIGDMRIGWKDSDPGPKTFDAALSNAESVLRGLAVGVSAFNRWSFTNRGDLDGQWQLIRTWDPDKKEYLKKINIEPAAYYGYGILTRFFKKNSSVLRSETDSRTGILSQTLKGPDGKITVFILNKSRQEQRIKIQFYGDIDDPFYLYQVSEKEVLRSDFKMDPSDQFIVNKTGEISLTIPARSMNTLTQIFLLHDQKVYTDHVKE